MGDDLVEQVAVGELFVHVGGVHVAGDRGKQQDVVVRERARDRGVVADLDLVEHVVLDVVHGHLPRGGSDSFAAAAILELSSETRHQE